MEIFITGATRVLGRPVVKSLIARGHRVRALSRSGANEARIRELGAVPLRPICLMLSLSSERLPVATRSSTSPPKFPPTMKMGKAEVWLENDRIRREGTRNLVEAALASKSVETVLFESYGMVYPDSGDAWIDADSTPAQPTLTLTSTIDGEAAVASFAEAGHRGISLRMGMIYGPESPAAWEQLRYLQMGIAAFPGSSNAYLPQVWVQDAARAIVVALTEPIPSGIYDIVDDDPLTRGELIATIAQAAGKKHYLTLPNSIMKMMTGIKYEDASRGLRTSNRRFKEVSNWRPTVPDARTGWKRMMEEQKVAATA